MYTALATGISTTMRWNPKRRSPAILAMAAALLTACEKSPTQSAPAAQIANPASVYCIERGGHLEIMNEAAGQVGYCVLADGRRVEEWAFFRAAQEAASAQAEASE
jgi:putative hemolysin